MLLRVSLVALALALAPQSLAAADLGARPSREATIVEALPAPSVEGVGCYWFRQRQFCARYCYYEVDGRRYCRERQDLAFPQAAFTPLFEER